MPSPFRQVLHNAAARIARDAHRPRGTHTAREVADYIATRTGARPCLGCGVPMVSGAPAGSHDALCSFAHPEVLSRYNRPAPGGAASLVIRGYGAGPALRGFHGAPSPAFPRYVGLEVESIIPGACAPAVEERLCEMATTWGATRDGSICAGPGERGVEWVSPAMRGEWATVAVKNLSRALVAAGGKVTTHTGLHCHVDVRDLDDSQWLGVVRVARHVDAGLFQVVAPSRPTAGYSHRSPACPLNHTRAVDAGEVPTALNLLYSGDRYRAVNTTNRGRGMKGTIEFRHHHGSIDHRKILHWARLCVAIVEYARTRGANAVNALPPDPWGALMAVAATAHDGAELIEWCNARKATLTGRRAA